MKYPHALYTQLAAIRARYGDQEYARDDIAPDVCSLIERHGASHAALLREAADSLLDRVEKQEDQVSTDGLFPYEAHVALGDGKRIKRGKMTESHAQRRKRIIDANKVAQDAAWARETAWLNACIDALAGRPLHTTVSDVLPIKPPAPAR